MTVFSSIGTARWDRLSLSARSRTIPGGKEMSFFDEFERSYTGCEKKEKKSRNERKEQDRQTETEQKQRRDRNDPYYE